MTTALPRQLRMLATQDEIDVDLFAGGGDHIELATIGGVRELAGQAEQAIGFAGHSRRHHDDLVASCMPFGDAARDVFNALDGSHRGPAVLMNDE